MTTLAERLFSGAFETEILEQLEDGPPLSEWSVAGKNRSKLKPDGEDINWWRQNGPPMVEAWIKWRQKTDWKIWNTPDEKLAIELALEVDYGGPEPWRGIIDRIFQRPDYRLVVVDLKTGGRTPESDLQLGHYKWAIERTYGVAVDWGAYWLARKGEMTPSLSLNRYTDHLIETWLTRFHAAKQAGIFLPHPSFRCRACSMRDYCTAYGGVKQHLDPDYGGTT